MGYIVDWIVMLVIASLGPVLFFVFRAKLLKKERESQETVLKASIEVEERQKLSVATNLHDEIIPRLSLIVQNVDFNLLDFERGEFHIGNVKTDKDLALDLINDLRSMALQLTPKVLIDLGLISALNSYISKIKSAYYTVVMENYSKYEENLPLSKDIEVNAYRTCLEIIRNIQKHESFTKLVVQISNDDSSLYIRFLHNGIGISDKEIKQRLDTSEGIGLRSIQSRLILMKGTLSYTTNPGSSTVILTIPTLR